ncbi:MAG: hypothetical protein R6X05_13805 [Desulfobacterales bacterium]
MSQKRRALRFLICLLIFWGAGGPAGVLPLEAQAKALALPLTIDYPLLRALVAATVFSGPDESLVVLDESRGCRRVVVSRPAYSGENGLVRSEFQVSILLGTALGDACLAPVNWEGVLVLRQRPRMEPGGWTLSFETVDSQVLDRQRQPAKLAGLIWDLVQTRVFDSLADVRIDLAPPVAELKAFLTELFPAADQPRAQAMVASLRAAGVTADAAAVRITLSGEVPEADDDVPDEPAEGGPRALSEVELAGFTTRWEVWDGYLAQILSALAGRELSQADRQVLLDVLLTTRHAFIQGLAENSLSEDFVRVQFVQAWQQLAGVYRRCLDAGPSSSLLAYLAFFTASDALAALDQIGPTLGIDISRAGLIRLVRLLGAEFDAQAADRDEIDPELRAVLGLGPPLEDPGPAFEGEGLEDGWPPETPAAPPTDAPGPVGKFFFPQAWAAAAPKQDSLAEIRGWMAPYTPAEQLLGRVRKLLAAAADQTLKKRPSDMRAAPFFRRLVAATAWQESCFRQYHVKDDKLVYLRSYNGSSVGLMQINERVWRGIYDLNQLRWSIRYNALAGCEVLDLYIAKYIEGNPKYRARAAKLSDERFAGLLYGMYNGGPGDFSRFLERSRTGRYHLSDKLFREKYGSVKAGRWQEARSCFGAGAN